MWVWKKSESDTKTFIFRLYLEYNHFSLPLFLPASFWAVAISKMTSSPQYSSYHSLLSKQQPYKCIQTCQWLTISFRMWSLPLGCTSMALPVLATSPFLILPLPTSRKHTVPSHTSHVCCFHKHTKYNFLKSLMFPSCLGYTAPSMTARTLA